MWALASAIHRQSRLKTSIYFVMWVLIFLVTMVLFSNRLPRMPDWSISVRQSSTWLGLLAVVALAAVPFLTRYITASVYASRYRRFSIADKLVTLTIREDGLEYDVADTMKAFLGWDAFKTRIKTRDALFLKTGDYEALMIPRRAFSDQASYDSAVAFVRSKVPNGPA